MRACGRRRWPPPLRTPGPPPLPFRARWTAGGWATTSGDGMSSSVCPPDRTANSFTSTWTQWQAFRSPDSAPSTFRAHKRAPRFPFGSFFCYLFIRPFFISYWMSAGVQAQVCSIGMDNAPYSCVYLDAADAPGPVTIDIDAPDGNPFAVRRPKVFITDDSSCSSRSK